MKKDTHRSNRTVSFAIIALVIACGLVAGPASAQANPYTVTFTGVTYDVAAGTSTWNYSLTWNPTDAAPWRLSHFSLQLCSTAVVVGATPPNYSVGSDGSLASSDCQLSSFHGIKWDGDNGLVTAGQTIHFSVTLAGLYDVGTILTASKAGTKCNLNTVPGPSLDCDVVDHPICSVRPSSSTICAGQSATFEAFVAGGIGPYTYAWSGPGGFTSEDKAITVSAAGTYSVVVTDSIGLATAGCEATLTVNDLPNPAPGSYEFCEGTSVELDAGAGEGWSYLWSNGATTQTTSVTAAGDYTVTVTNANGCQATATHTVAAKPKPQPNGSSREICEGETSTLDAGEFASYLWSTGATTRTIDVTAEGKYTVTVTNAEGCSNSAEHELIVNPLPEPAGSSTEICEGETATLDAGEFATYLWSTGATTRTIDVTEAGTYTVTVTSAKGCVGSATHKVDVNPLPEPVGSSQEICEGETATLDAGDFASYLWSTGATTRTIDVTAAGEYTVTVSTAAGCTAQAVHDVDVNPLPAPVGSSQEICEGATATLDAGEFASYLWSTGATTRTIDVTAAGQYTVTVRNAKGCEASATHNVDVNPLPEPQGSSQEICEGATATLDAGEFASYLWSTGATTRTIDVTEAGAYTVTVTDGKGCQNSATHSVAVNPLPEPQGSSREICEGETATLDAGEFASYLWSTGATTRTIDVTEAGTYTVTVTTGKGCVATATHVVVVNPLPQPQGSEQEICAGATATLDAGDFASYLWSTGATTRTIEVTAGGTYTVTVTSDKGCKASATHTVAVNPLPEPDGSSQEICDGATATLDAGDGFASYRWSTGATTRTIEVTAAGSYTVTVTNGKGCENTATHVVIVNPLPKIADSSREVCEGGEATFDLNLPQGWTVEWSGPGGALAGGPALTVSEAGDYFAKVTTDKGCVATSKHTLVVNPLPEPQGSSKETCEGTPATLDAGEGFASYLWSTGATTQTIEVAEEGLYTVTVTTDKGCSAQAEHHLTVNARPDPKDSEATVCEGEEHTFDAGAGEGWSYEWSNGSTDQTITVTTAGTYTVAVTNAKGCSSEAEHELIVNPLPPADITLAGEVCADSAGNAASTPDAGAGAIYEWSISNGTITSEAPYGASIVFTAGEDATTPVTLSVTVTSADGCVKSDTAQSATKACTEGCSLTQGAWGSLAGAGTLAQVEALIGADGLQVGIGNNSFNVKQSDAPCLVQVLPAGGAPKSLSGYGTFTAGQPKCTTNPNLVAKNNGKLNNVFLGQMISFTLNLRDNADLAAITLCATMKTQAVIHTAEGDALNPGADGILGTSDDPIITVSIPQSVLNALDAAGLPRTTLGLLELGNLALGGMNVGASVADVNAAVDAINIGFDGCRIKIDCVPVSTLSPQAMLIVNGEQSVELCNRVATFDRSGEARDIELATSVLDGIRSLDLPLDLKGLARLAELARNGRAGVPVDDLNLAIDAINVAAGEGRLLGGCGQ